MATQILPWEPSPTEKRKQWIAENVFGPMDDRYRANRLSQGIVDVADMIPFYGDIEGVREGYHLATEENSPWLGAGIGALGVLPFIPGSVTRQGTDFLREQAAKLRVTPTQYTVEKTDPMSQNQAVETERLIYSDRPDVTRDIRNHGRSTIHNRNNGRKVHTQEPILPEPIQKVQRTRVDTKHVEICPWSSSREC